MSEMNNLEYFEQERNAEEQKAFEQELAQNDELRKEYQAYQALTTAIKRLGWKQDIQSAQKQHKAYKALIKTVIAIVTLTLITGIAYLLTNQEEPKSEPEIIQSSTEFPSPQKEIKPIPTTSSQEITRSPKEVYLTRIESETFSVVGNQDNILETKKGALISIPEGTLVDEDGHTVEGEMTMTLTEIYDAIDILKTGLSTESNGKPLETGGMFEFKVEQNGKPIKVKDGKKIVFDIPSNTPRGNMSLFEGEYMEDGSVNWVNPKPIKNYLTKVDIHSLNFYPEGFEQKVLELGFENPSKKTLDSLFYSFYCEDDEPKEDSTWLREDKVSKTKKDLIEDDIRYIKSQNYKLYNESELLKYGENLYQNNCMQCHKIFNDDVGPRLYGITKRQPLEWIISYTRWANYFIEGEDEHAIMLKGKYETEMPPFPTLAYQEVLAIISYVESNGDSYATIKSKCGIEPAMIKAIWNDKFQNTFIATQEFEERLKVLYKACDASLLQLYLDNLDKNMWEVDQMVVERSSGSVKMRFEHFVEEKKTNIEDVDPAYRQLNAYYLKQSQTYLKAIRKTSDTYWAKQRELDRKAAKRKQKKQEQSAKAAREQYRKEFEHNLKSVYKQLGIKPTPARALRARGRRRSYQVAVTNTGIYNIDRFVTEMTANRTSGKFAKNGKTAKIIYKPIQVTVTGKDTFDFVNVYVQTNSLPSFVKIKSQTEDFDYQLNNDFRYQLIVIAEKEKQLYMYSSDLAGDTKYQVTLESFDKREIPDFFSAALAREVDYSRFILQEEKRRKERARVLEIQSALRPIIFPCSPKQVDVYGRLSREKLGKDIESGAYELFVVSAICAECQQYMASVIKNPDNQVVYINGSDFELSYFLKQTGIKDNYILINDYSKFKKLQNGYNFPLKVTRTNGFNQYEEVLWE